jgi:hypothetical protein
MRVHVGSADVAEVTELSNRVISKNELEKLIQEAKKEGVVELSDRIISKEQLESLFESVKNGREITSLDLDMVKFDLGSTDNSGEPLTYTGLTGEVLDRLTKEFSKLRQLYLLAMNIDLKALGVSIGIGNWKGLRYLNLNGSYLDTEGAKALFGGITYHHSLSVLALAGCGLTDAVMSSLSATLTLNRSLVSVNLRNNNLSEANWKKLAEAVKSNPCILEVEGDRGICAIDALLAGNLKEFRANFYESRGARGECMEIFKLAILHRQLASGSMHNICEPFDGELVSNFNGLNELKECLAAVETLLPRQGETASSAVSVVASIISQHQTESHRRVLITKARSRRQGVEEAAMNAVEAAVQQVGDDVSPASPAK